jgi:hypothetical protein
MCFRFYADVEVVLVVFVDCGGEDGGVKNVGTEAGYDGEESCGAVDVAC